MKIYLPSNGKLGFKTIRIRNPKINDVRKVPDFSDISELRKTEFVKLLSENPDTVDKITRADRDYLFVVLVGVLSLNEIPFLVNCCNEEIKGKLFLSELEPKFLSESLKKVKEIHGKQYEFKTLLVEDEEEIVVYASAEPDDKYDESFEDAVVAKVLGYEVSKESIDKMKNELDLAIYVLALIYNDLYTHGVHLTKFVECPICKNKIKVNLPVSGKMLNVDMGMIMSRYQDIMKIIDFSSFCDMTFPEYATLIQAINLKNI